MKLVIIHVGMPKTGTTALQVALSNGQCGWAGGGNICYPSAGRFRGSAAHHELFLSALDSAEKVRTPLPEARRSFETVVADVIDEWEKSNCQVLLLSCEMVWNREAFGRVGLERVRREFAGVDLRVVVSLREVVRHALSGYAQRVTGPQRYSGTFSEHVAELANDGRWDYSARLGDFASVFGKEAVYPFWYEEARGDLAEVVLSVAGVENPKVHLSPEQ